MQKDDVFSINEKEVMEFYGYKGVFGQVRLKAKLIRSWILHSLAYSSPLSDFVIRVQRSRGVKIGKNCHFSPYILIDLVYPKMITIEDNVTIGSNVMIFAHINPTANLELKRKAYPRKVAPVIIRSGVVINPGSVVTAGVTIGKNAIVSVGSVITENVPDYCVVVGNPARVVKRIE